MGEITPSGGEVFKVLLGKPGFSEVMIMVLAQIKYYNRYDKWRKMFEKGRWDSGQRN